MKMLQSLSENIFYKISHLFPNLIVYLNILWKMKLIQRRIKKAYLHLNNSMKNKIYIKSSDIKQILIRIKIKTKIKDNKMNMT